MPAGSEPRFYFWPAAASASPSCSSVSLSSEVWMIVPGS